jgi:hypothetical protein
VSADLLRLQAPLGVPRSTFFETTTDPLLPPWRTTEMLAHFYDAIYDLRPESHLSRLLKVVLGDTGTGQLRKRYTYAHLSQFLLTTHYTDLDLLYGGVFGLHRFLRERLDIDPYLEALTEAEWEALDAADASYRARIEAFSHALSMAGTPSGLIMAAQAILGSEVRLYETYPFVDDADIYAPEVAATVNTWGDLEALTYAEASQKTYAELEGTNIFHQRLPGSRHEFVLRPLRSITAEERYHLAKVLGRLKPAGALMTIDDRPAVLHRPVGVARAASSSSYWRVRSQVQVADGLEHLYDRAEPGVPVEQPRFAFSAYQGEAWSYNGDVVSVESYSEDPDGNLEAPVNYDTGVDASGTVYRYTPDLALADQSSLLLGRAVSDGILVAPAAVREAVGS